MCWEKIGGHLNPAVTLALALVRHFPWKKLPVYWCAQYLGAMAASGTVLGVYYGNIQINSLIFDIFWKPNLSCVTNKCVEGILEGKVGGEFRIRKNITEPGMASIFANYPAPYSSASIGLVEEVMTVYR